MVAKKREGVKHKNTWEAKRMVSYKPQEAGRVKFCGDGKKDVRQAVFIVVW